MKFTEYGKDLGLLILRLALGAVFIAHGGQKVFGLFGGHGLQGTAQFMSKLGIPPFLAYAASFAEFFGGVGVLLGLITPLAALGLAVTMAVAIFKAHLADGFFMPKGFEYPLSLLGMSLCLAVGGPGRLSVDYLVLSKLLKKGNKPSG